MKISNLKRAKILGVAIMTLSFFPIAVFFISENSIWKIVCLSFFVAMLVVIINLRGIEIENSGECFSLRERHPFVERKYVPSKIEFPISSIAELNIQEGLFANQMNIKIRSNQSVKKFNISLPFFTRHQILKINRLLEKKKQG